MVHVHTLTHEEYTLRLPSPIDNGCPVSTYRSSVLMGQGTGNHGNITVADLFRATTIYVMFSGTLQQTKLISKHMAYSNYALNKILMRLRVIV